MDLFWKAVGGLLIAAILGIILGKDMAVMLTMAVCAMGTVVVIHYLNPVFSFIKQIEALANIGEETLRILFKVLGIGMIAEIVSMICADADSAAFGKLLKILSCAAIFWVSLPVFQSVLSLLQQLLEEI